jgi:Domain of unknown function (DUF4224)
LQVSPGLTEDELVELTGYKLAKQQKLALGEMAPSG